MEDSAPRVLDARALAGLGLLFVFLLAASWGRWTQPIVDHGREMNLPARVAAGETLYRDVQFLYGPFAPYFNAALYRTFGVRLGVLHAAGAISAALIVLLIYFLARQFMNATEAGVTAGLVLTLCALKSTANYVSPYAYASLYGLLFTLGSLIGSISYWREGRSRWIAVAGMLAGLALISKWELALAALVAGGAAAALRSLTARRILWRDALWLVLPASAVVAAAYGFILSRVEWRTLVEDNHILFSKMPPQLVYFNEQISGLADWPRSFWYTLSGVGMLALWGGVVTMLGALPAVRSGEGKALLRRGLWIAIGGAAGWLGLYRGFGIPGDATILTGMPIVLPLLLGLLAVRIGRAVKANDGIGFRPGALLLVGLFAQVSILRVILKVKTTGPYVPFFIPALLVVCAWLLLIGLPETIAPAGALQRQVRRAATIVIALLVLGTAVGSAVRFRRHNTFEVRTERGGFLTEPQIGGPLAAAIEYARSHTSADDAVLSLPQATSINFLAARRYPFREEIVHPGFLSDEEGIRRLDADPPRLILIVNLLTPEFRDRVFGSDYNPGLWRWIEERYRLTARFDSEPGRGARLGDDGFFILAYEPRGTGVEER